MHTETKAMICTAAVLIAMGIFKELAAVCLITAVVFEEGVKKFDNKKEKSAHGAATPLGTLLNKQDQYNTDRQKSEIRKIATEIFDLSLQLQEMTDGTIDWIDWREPGVPCVYVEYHGATAVLSVKIWENGFSAEQRPDYSTMLFLDNPNCMIEAGYLKEKLMGLLEERRGSDNEE